MEGNSDRIEDLTRKCTYGYNNSNSTKTFYVHFCFRSGDKGTILMILLGASTDYGCIKRYLPIAANITTSWGAAKNATVQASGSGSGYNGEQIKRQSDGTYILAITNVQAYAVVEMISENCEIIQSYYA